MATGRQDDRTEAEPVNSGAGPGAADVKKRPRRRKRRWLRWLVGALIVVVLLILSAPYILSTGLGVRIVVGVVNGQIHGSISMESISLSWFGPCKVRQLAVTDTDGRTVLDVKEIVYAGGILGGLTSAVDFGRVSIDSPRAWLYVDPGRETSLLRALSLRKPRPRRPGEPLPEPKGTITIRRGFVRLEHPDGRAYEIKDVDAEFDLNTLAALSGELSLSLAGGGRFRGEVNLRQLVSGGKIALTEATGDAKIVAADVDVGRLGEFGFARAGMSGLADLDATVKFDAGRLEGAFKTGVKGLSAPHLKAARVRPIDLALAGQFVGTPERIEGRTDLTGQAGEFHVGFFHRPTDQQAEVRSDDVVAAVVAGKSLALPDFKLTISGNVDLAALGRSVPALMKIRRDVEITDGQVLLEDIIVTGGTEPAAKGKIELTGLKASRGRQEINWKPIGADFDVFIQEGEGLQIRRADLRWPEVAGLQAKGTPRKLDGSFNADLAKLHQQISQIIDLGSFTLAGTLKGTLTLRPKEKNLIAAEFGVDARSFAYSAGERKLQLERAHVDFVGDLIMGERGVDKLVIASASADLDGAVAAGASGWLEPSRKTFSAEIGVDRADLAYLGRLAKGLGHEELARHTGTLKIPRTKVTRATPDGPISLAGGRIEVDKLGVDGELLAATASFSWSNVRLAPKEQSLDVDEAKLASPFLAFSAKDIRYGYGQTLSVSGEISQLTADLKRCFSAAGRVAQLEKLPAPEGQLTCSLSCRTQDDRVTFQASGRIDETRSDPVRVVSVEGSGWYEPQRRTFHGKLDVKPADLGYLSRQLRPHFEQVPECAGTLVLNVNADRASPEGPILLAGGVSVAEARVDGKPVSGKDPIRLDWTGARFDQAHKLLTLTQAKLEGAPAGLSAKDIRCQFGEEFALDGQVEELSADLGKCLEIAGSFAKWEQPPQVAGTLKWSGSARTTERVTTFSGKGHIENLQYGTGPQTVRQERVTFDQDGKVDWRAEDFTLDKFEINSKLLFASVQGVVRKFRTTRELDLTGRYSASWDDLMPLLQQFAPEVAQKVAFSGRPASEIRITGPANRPQVRPVYRGLDAGLNVGWDGGQAYGLKLGKALLSPSLHDGQLNVPVVTITAGEGKVRVGCLVDFQTTEPVLRMPGKTQVLEGVPLTAELGKDLLSRMNPIFSELEMGQAKGKISLLVDDLRIPMKKELLDGAGGRGHLDLSDMKIVPSGVLAKLLELAGQATGEAQPVKVSGLDFEIKDGRVKYDNFTMTFVDMLDLQFFGSVGFDDTVDMGVSIPVRTALLKRLGVSGPLAEYARLLEGARVKIPIVGTRLKPRLDLSKVDISPLIQRAIRALLTEEAAKRAADILKPKRPATDPSQPTTKPAPASPEQQVLESIFDILQDRLKDRTQD